LPHFASIGNKQKQKRFMARPRLKRRIQFKPRATSFKPDLIGEDFFDAVELTMEEAEAIRLKNIKGLDQTEAAKKMKTSQSTFQRILTSAYKKISKAIVDGRIISIK
jgi:predicted DNA-binding protein (UPF0251 family)